MSRLTSVALFVERPRWFAAVLALTFLGLSAGSAEASPIRQYNLSARSATNLGNWSSFLAGGPSVWARRSAPRITGGVRAAMAQALGSANSRLSPWVQYLLWRQSLNPLRFNRWHPQMVPYLNLPPTTCPCSCTPCKPITPQQVHKPPRTVTPGVITPPSTPEPNTVLISLCLIGSGCLWRYHTGRTPQAPAE
jgi:hypothetical protein